MALFTSTVPWRNAGAAVTVTVWRNACQMMHDAYIACGFVQTADSGQYDIAAASLPSAATYGGFRIYKMNDALGTASPVYIKLEFYLAGSAGSIEGHVTVGFATDGAGTLTGNKSTARINCYTASTENTAAPASFFSGDGGRISHVYNTGAATNSCNWSNIERLRDSTGAYVGDGVVIVKAIGNAYSHEVVYRTGNNLYKLSKLGVVATDSSATAADGADVYTFPLFPVGRGVHNQMVGVIAYYNADITGGIVQTVDVYGVSRTYWPFGLASANTMGVLAGLCPMVCRD